MSDRILRIAFVKRELPSTLEIEGQVVESKDIVDRWLEETKEDYGKGVLLDFLEVDGLIAETLLPLSTSHDTDACLDLNQFLTKIYELGRKSASKAP